MSESEDKPGVGSSSESSSDPRAKPIQKPTPSLPEKPQGPPNTDFRTLWIDRSRVSKLDDKG